MATETLRPNGAGAYTALEQYPASDYNWDKVDEESPDDASTYVWSPSSFTFYKDAYALTDTAIPAGSIINSVRVYLRTWGYGVYRPGLRLGTSETDGTQTGINEDWTTHSEILARPGGGSWAVSDLNALQVVISLLGDVDAGATVRCTQVYIVVDYTTPIIVTPGTLALTLTTYNPVLKLTLTPPTLALSLTLYAPSINIGTLVTPTTLALTLALYAPNIIVGTIITPTTLALTLTAYAPSIPPPDGNYLRIAFATDPFTAIPTWADVSADLVSLHTKRGRQNQLDRFEAGTATILLKNIHGNYWPYNTGGDYYPGVKVGKRISLQAVRGGSIYDLYTGFVRKWTPVWFSQEGLLYPGIRLECADLQRNLSRAKLNTSYGQEASGSRVGRVLDSVGWPAADRAIETGKAALQASGTLANVISMEHLYSVQESELGLFWIRGDGYAIFQERGARLVAPYDTSQATFGDGGLPMYDPVFVLDDDLLYNEVRLTRTGGTEQVLSDADSIANYGLRSLAKSGLFLTADSIVLAYCYYYLYRFKNTKFRLAGITIKPQVSPALLWPKALGYEIGTCITVARTEASISHKMFIEGIEHDYDSRRGEWKTEWQLSDAAQYYAEIPTDVTILPSADSAVDWLGSHEGDKYLLVRDLSYSTLIYRPGPDTGTHYATFDMDDVPPDSTSVNGGISLNFQAASAYIEYITPYIRLGGVNYYGATRMVISGSWQTFTDTWGVNPATGLAWTIDDVNALQAGVRAGPEAALDAKYVPRIWIALNVMSKW